MNPGCADDQQSSRRVHRYRHSQLSEDAFASKWKSSVPIIVEDVDQQFQTLWTPTAFAERFGNMKCEVEDCESGEVATWKVGEFFSQFGQARSSSARSLKLKVSNPRVLVVSSTINIGGLLGLAS